MKKLLLSSALLLGTISALFAAAGSGEKAEIISYQDAFNLLNTADDKEKFDMLIQIFTEYDLKIDISDGSECAKIVKLIDSLYIPFYHLILTILQKKHNITKENILEILRATINAPVNFLSDAPLLYIDHFEFYSAVNKSRLLPRIQNKYILETWSETAKSQVIK